MDRNELKRRIKLLGNLIKKILISILVWMILTGALIVNYYS